MGLFDWFRKRKSTVMLAQLSYDVAYFVLPQFVFRDLNSFAEMLETPTAAGPYFYFVAAKMRNVEPDAEDAKRFHWHQGSLDEDREYFVLEYPTPPPVDMSDVSMGQLMRGAPGFVLAPYFSAIIRGPEAAKYFILGQAPMEGTTLRCILPDGMNCNLGPGPEPELSAFLDVIRERATEKD